MRRFLTISVTLLALLVSALPSEAAVRWCNRDPIVKLDGVTYQVLVSVPQKNVPQIDGELLFEIYSPKGSTQELLYVDEGYNGYGEKVVFKEHDQTGRHTFFLDVPHNGDKFPVLVEILREGVPVQTALGTSDVMWVSVPIQ